ncbi:hypothetical protein Pcinc_019297 [Petrolisthes cinctipes]|uniref:Uncharacterized protein n=1 Tax=Petrolisthes cinctipes TaxID=88211 RepID=A0AAE1FL65_PETCI|nr:hypothetical protein Pcinc_019297 [Petrolisthes cinctipes]
MVGDEIIYGEGQDRRGQIRALPTGTYQGQSDEEHCTGRQQPWARVIGPVGWLGGGGGTNKPPRYLNLPTPFVHPPAMIRPAIPFLPSTQPTTLVPPVCGVGWGGYEAVTLTGLPPVISPLPAQPCPALPSPFTLLCHSLTQWCSVTTEELYPRCDTQRPPHVMMGGEGDVTTIIWRLLRS